jgi:catechol 2,3-dioxygenase
MITPTERSENPIVAGVTIGHVHLKTADIDRIHDFYVGVLGFDVIMQIDNEALFVSSGGYHHTLAFNTWESKGGTPPPLGTTGLYHVAIKYPTRHSLGDALRRLVEAHYPLAGMSDHGTHEALYLNDPDGNGLELCWDRPEEEWPVTPEGYLAHLGRELDIQGLLKA